MSKLNSGCCITKEDQETLAKGVDQLYQASAQSPLTAPQHQGLVETAQSLMNLIQKIGKQDTSVSVMEEPPSK